jgi:hypothetical protein
MRYLGAKTGKYIDINARNALCFSGDSQGPQRQILPVMLVVDNSASINPRSDLFHHVSFILLLDNKN